MDWFGGGACNGLAAMNVTTGAPLAWMPSIGTSYNSVQSMSVDTANDIVYVGGNFTTVNAQLRNNLVAINGVSTASPGTVTDWVAAVNGGVNAVLFEPGSPATLFIGGVFSSATGIARGHLAAINVTTATVTAWDPEPGQPSSIPWRSQGQCSTPEAPSRTPAAARGELAAYDFANAGALTPWAPNVTNGQVYGLLVDGGNIYASGSFTSIGGLEPGLHRRHQRHRDGGEHLDAIRERHRHRHDRRQPGRHRRRLVQLDQRLQRQPESQQHQSAQRNRLRLLAQAQRNGLVLRPLQQHPDCRRQLRQLHQCGDRRRAAQSEHRAVPLVPLTNPGDLDGNGVVDQNDLNIVLSHFGYRITDPGWDPRADANGDGVVNVDDLNIVLANMGRTYP